jgi:hypothetical protein
MYAGFTDAAFGFFAAFQTTTYGSALTIEVIVRTSGCI